MSIIATLPVFVLSNSIALNGLLQKNCLHHCYDSDAFLRDWEGWVRSTYLKRDASRPGHVFDMRWAKFSHEGRAYLVKAMDCLGEEFLMVRNQRLYIRDLSQFAYWQNLRGRMSTLPVKCWMLYKRQLSMRDLLVHPLEAILDEYIGKEGLNESHLHLHACQSPEISWLLHVSNTSRFEYQELLRKESNKKLYASTQADLTPERLIARVRLANILRRLLLEVMAGCNLERCVEEMKSAYCSMVKYPEILLREALVSYVIRDTEKLHNEELALWRYLFGRIDRQEEKWREIQFFAHLYLLIKNEYLSLFRHNELRRGFSSFQMVTHHTRPVITWEKYYRDTFRNLFRCTDIRSNTCIELRLFPRSFIKRAPYLLQWWNEEWFKYLEKKNGYEDSCSEAIHAAFDCHCRKKVPQPVFVLHFSKTNTENHKANEKRKTKMDRERYLKKRKALFQECTKLIGFIKSFGMRQRVAVGIDAAGDELQLSADVFAPIFRLFERETSISHRTYHCGEDFYHLLGGIRSVYDAVVFLDMRCGNRLGHATAIGILPSQWRKHMPAKLCMPRGDYMLDLIFASMVLSEGNLTAKAKAEAELLRQARHIFPGKPLSVHVLQDFYETRHFKPDCAKLYGESHVFETIDDETKLVAAHIKKWGKMGVEFLYAWNYEMKTQNAAAELVEVDRDLFDDDTLVELQQKVQKLIRNRKVVLETLPVSNLRISQYEDIRQHHLLRWLGVPGCALPGDYQMNVCMGSDDPGIFVTDIKNEYYHIFSNLCQAGLTPAECMVYVKRLNDAGSAYAFHSISPPML